MFKKILLAGLIVLGFLFLSAEKTQAVANCWSDDINLLETPLFTVIGANSFTNYNIRVHCIGGDCLAKVISLRYCTVPSDAKGDIIGYPLTGTWDTPGNYEVQLRNDAGASCPPTVGNTIHCRDTFVVKTVLPTCNCEEDLDCVSGICDTTPGICTPFIGFTGMCKPPPPKPACSIEICPDPAKCPAPPYEVGDSIQFGYSGGDNAKIEWYAWDFDSDGIVDVESAWASTANHAYSAAGTYTVRLTITEKFYLKRTNTCLTTITIGAAPGACPGNAPGSPAPNEYCCWNDGAAGCQIGNQDCSFGNEVPAGACPGIGLGGLCGGVFGPSACTPTIACTSIPTSRAPCPSGPYSGYVDTCKCAAANDCTKCILSQRQDVLPFHRCNGWDTTCSNWNSVRKNWCNSVSEEASCDCRALILGACATACAADDKPACSKEPPPIKPYEPLKCVPIAKDLCIPTDISGFASFFFTLLAGLAIVLAILALIIAGYRLIFSTGDKYAVADAKALATRAVAGLAFILGTYLILKALGTILGIEPFKIIFK